MNAKYTAMELAMYIIGKCIQDRNPISNLQLQKILFYIQREFLRVFGVNVPAFGDDIEAWQIGPVVPNVYDRFCGYGSMPITRLHKSFEIGTEDIVMIDSIVESKRILPPWDLVRETHKPGGAWDKVHANGKGNHQEIPLRLILELG